MGRRIPGQSESSGETADEASSGEVVKRQTPWSIDP